MGFYTKTITVTVNKVKINRQQNYFFWAE